MNMMATDTVAPPRYFLAEHMFPCFIDGGVILLDLRHDQYVGLDDDEARALQTVLGLRPVSHHDTATPDRKDGGTLDLDRFCRDMVAKGVLTQDTAHGKQAETVTVPCPPLDLTGYDVTKKRRVRPGHVFTLVKAAIGVSLGMRFTSLEKVIARVRRRKQTHAAKVRAGQAPATPDRERVRELVEIFRLVRLFLFTSKDFCLYDSLVLVDFLAPYGIYPDLILGVKMGPFQAHAWVQDDTYIYNGCISDIDLMTPIMAV